MALEFARPGALYLLLLIPAFWLLAWPWAGGGVTFARGDSVREFGRRWRPDAGVVLVLPRFLRALALAAVVVALAEPQGVDVVEERRLVGKGLGIALDLSTSMLATDMEGGASRIDAAREAAIQFADRREHDELSLVAFAGEAVTRIPPTTDREVVKSAVESLRIQLVRDGTDISAGVLTSMARLLESEREPRVIVLLTDGAHNGTSLPPLAAARAAAAMDVRIHAISFLPPADAAGASPVTPARTDVLGEMRTVLGGIAEITGGAYFHASGAAALDSIFHEIDRLEAPTEAVTESEIRRPLRGRFLLFGLLVLGADVLLRGSRWGVIS
jgi:Ca-activated chloride channel homolog